MYEVAESVGFPSICVMRTTRAHEPWGMALATSTPTTSRVVSLPSSTCPMSSWRAPTTAPLGMGLRRRGPTY